MQGENASAAQQKEGQGIFQGWKKFLAPPNFIKQEEKLETMDPPSRYTFEIMMKRLDALIAGTPNADIRQQLNYTKADMLVEREKSKLSEDMIVDFIQWILGTSDKNVVFESLPVNPNGVPPSLDTVNEHPIITPWGNKPYTFLPDVQDFLDGIVDERAAVEKFISKLKLHGPRNLPELWIYYKYIVLKQGLDGLVIEYARFLEPYMGPPPPKVPLNPDTGNDAYRYYSREKPGDDSVYIGESQRVNAYDREGPNPPGFSPENSRQLLDDFQNAFGDILNIQLPNAQGPDDEVLLAADVANAFSRISRNGYAYPEDLRRQIDAQMASQIAALPDGVFKDSMISLFGYGYDDNGLPTRVNNTIANQVVNALNNPVPPQAPLPPIQNVMANNPNLQNALIPNNILAGQLGTLGNQLQALTTAITNMQLPAPAPAIRLQGNVPVVDIGGAQIQIPNNIGINFTNPQFVDVTGALYDFNNPIIAPQQNITVPGQRVQVGAPTITQQQPTYTDSLGNAYNFNSTYNPVVTLPGMNIAVGKPTINALNPNITYDPAYKNPQTINPTINLDAPGDITVGKVGVNFTQAPKVDTTQYKQAQTVLAPGVTINDQPGNITVGATPVYIPNQPAVDTTEYRKNWTVTPNPVNIDEQPGSVTVEKTPVKLEPKTPTIFNQQYTQSQTVTPDTLEIDADPGSVTVNPTPVSIKKKSPSVVAGKTGDTTIVMEEPESRPFPKMVSQNEIMSELVTDAVNDTDFEEKVKSAMKGVLQPYGEKLDQIEKHLANLTGGQMAMNRGITPLESLLRSIRTGQVDAKSSIEKKLQSTIDAIKHTNPNAGLKVMNDKLGVLLNKFPDFTPLTTAIQQTNQLTAQVIEQNKHLAQQTNLVREEMNQNVRTFADFMRGSVDTFREIKRRLNNDGTKDMAKTLITMNGKLMTIIRHLKAAGETNSLLYKTMEQMIVGQQGKLDNILAGKEKIRQKVDMSRKSRMTNAISRMRQKATLSQLTKDVINLESIISGDKMDENIQGQDMEKVKHDLIDLRKQKMELISKMNMDFLKSEIGFSVPKVFGGSNPKGADTGVEAVSESFKNLEQKLAESDPATQNMQVFTLQDVINEVNQATGGALQGQQVNIPQNWLDLLNRVNQDFSERVAGLKESREMFRNQPATPEYREKMTQYYKSEISNIEEDIKRMKRDQNTEAAKAKIKTAKQVIRSINLELNALGEGKPTNPENLVAGFTANMRYEENQRAYDLFKDEAKALAGKYQDVNSPEYGVAIAELLNKYKNVIDPRFMESLVQKMSQTQGINWEQEYQNYRKNRHAARANAGMDWRNTPNKVLDKMDQADGKPAPQSRLGDGSSSGASIKNAGQNFFPDLDYKEMGFNSREEMTAFVNGVIENLYNENPNVTEKDARNEAAKMLALKAHNAMATQANEKFMDQLRDVGQQLALEGEEYELSEQGFQEFLLAYQSFRKPSPDDEYEKYANKKLKQPYKDIKDYNSPQRLYEKIMGIPKGSRSKSTPPIQQTMGEYADIFFESSLALSLLESMEKYKGSDGSAGGVINHLRKIKEETIQSFEDFLEGGNSAMSKISLLTKSSGAISAQVLSRQIMAQAVSFFQLSGNEDLKNYSEDILEAIDMYTADSGVEDIMQGKFMTLPQDLQSNILKTVAMIPGHFQSVVNFMHANGIPFTNIPKLTELRQFEDLSKEDTSGIENILEASNMIS